MSEPDSADDDEPETVQINLRLSKAFLDDIDTTWKEEVSTPEANSSGMLLATR